MLFDTAVRYRYIHSGLQGGDDRHYFADYFYCFVDGVAYAVYYLVNSGGASVQIRDRILIYSGQTVYVRCDAVPAPVAVRYSYRNLMDTNLKTSYGIPVPPFRTDDWPL